MTAMDNATRNAGEMIDKLTLTYNRTRQAIDHQRADRNHFGRRSAVNWHRTIGLAKFRRMVRMNMATNAVGRITQVWAPSWTSVRR